MNNTIKMLSELSMGFLFSLPYIYVCLRMDYITNKMKYKSYFSGSLMIVAAFSFLLGVSTIKLGEVAESVFFIWGGLTLTIMIALITLINEITVDYNIEPHQRDTNKVSFIRKIFKGRFQKLRSLHKNKFINKLNTKIVVGIPLSNLISLAILALVALSLIVADINTNIPSVLDYHKNIINKISDSDDPEMVVIKETTSNGDMAVNLIHDIQKIKIGEVTIVSPSPWGADIRVQCGNEFWTLNYSRIEDTWELEGVQIKGSYHY